MVFKEVWENFLRLDDQEELARQGSQRNELFARWQCPNCPFIVKTLAQRAKRGKADACAYHYWRSETPCPGRPADDLRGKPKAKDVSTSVDAVQKNTSATEENTAITRDIYELLKEQLEVQKQLVVLETARANREKDRGDRWKHRTRGYHEDSNVSSPRSSDSDGERTAKQQRVHEKKRADGRQFELKNICQVIGVDAPEEPHL